MDTRHLNLLPVIQIKHKKTKKTKKCNNSNQVKVTAIYYLLSTIVIVVSFAAAAAAVAVAALLLVQHLEIVFNVLYMERNERMREMRDKDSVISLNICNGFKKNSSVVY
uniref:Uncharacterized protein n=1 Tax=Glossina brevipalpis TaxID=37001 RepID=A0A1A9WDA5_9MUSC